LGKHRYLAEAAGFHRQAGRDAPADKLSGSLPGSSRYAVIASALALYPSTTTEIPFT
jgi:hypothetical protein